MEQTTPQTTLTREPRAGEALSVRRLFTYAAWADKWDGAVHNVPIRGVALAMHEPIGVIGIAAPEEFPLLGLISTVAPAVDGTTLVLGGTDGVHDAVRDAVAELGLGLRRLEPRGRTLEDVYLGTGA